MSDVLQQIRPWLEMLSFISGIVLAGAGVYALQQVRLMKQDMELTSERAAREKAIEYVSRYLSTYVPLAGLYTQELDTKKLTVYKGPCGDFTLTSIPADALPLALKRFQLRSWLPSVNELHTIAAAFAYGVADDKIGFQAIGRTFCATVLTKYDLLCIARGRDNTCRHYQGIIDLYNLWAPRLSKAELVDLREQLDERLANLGQQHM